MVLCSWVAEWTSAQVVYPPVVVFDDDRNYFEPTIAVDVAGPQGNAHKILVAAIHTLAQQGGGAPGARIAYGISLNGGQSFVEKGFLEAPGSYQFKTTGDPSATASLVDGTMWLAYAAVLGFGSASAIILHPLPQGSSTLGSGVPIVEHPSGPLLDKPLLAAGPALNPNDPERLYATYATFPQDCGSTFLSLYGAKLAGATWTNELQIKEPGGGPCEYRGHAPGPVVLSDGTVVVVSSDRHQGGFYRNDGRPWVVISNNEADPDSWSVEARIGAGAVPTIEAPAATDTSPPELADQGRHWPSIAVDRSKTPNWVYVAFTARREVGSSNVDIYIARSTDGGETFLNQNILHLTDEVLHGITPDANGPDQVLPAIVVDGCGVPCLIWYDTRNDVTSTDETEVDVYFARIRDFATPNPIVTVIRLSEQSFSATYQGQYGPTPLLFGHYQQIAARGRRVYPSYVKYVWDDTLQDWRRRFFVQRISVTCLADFNLNGEADSEDVVLFNAAYFAGDGEADLNGDGAIDAEDYVLFTASYSGVCSEE